MPHVARMARVSPSTIDGWLYGATKRPQNATVAAVLDALGVAVSYTWRHDGRVVKVPADIAACFKRTRKS